MALFKTLKTLISRRNYSDPRSIYLHFHTSNSIFPFIPLQSPSPKIGPLFLSSQPWKLFQRTTPLYFHGELVKFPKNLLNVSSLPIGLDFLTDQRRVNGLIERKEKERLDLGAIAASEKFLNLPNLVSIGRMVSGPVIGLMIMNEWYFPAFGALILSGATDWLDGFLARKMGIHSVIGSYLDPLADKILIGCVALSMVKMDLLHPGLVGLVIFRDVGLVGGAVYKRASMMNWQWNSWSEFFNLDGPNREKVEPLFISKVNTVFQLMLVAAALLQPDFGTEETQHYITYLSWLVACTTSVSTVGYGIQYFRNRPGVRTW
ncbi:hypothetical protein LUZ60_001394 [Juncus effusus]|nr:hypothetical protein LUZ60_001394 [Juncus effusus]